MPEPWQQSVIGRLLTALNTDGSWGYRPEACGSTEATALAALALAAHNSAPEARAGALAWLETLQRPDGAVPVSAGLSEPCWPTALAVLAWLLASTAKPTRQSVGGQADRSGAHPRVEKATAWLLGTCGLALAHDARLFGHDTTLSGWPWTEGTHSFVEPTAMAVLALRLFGEAKHPRVQEGVQVLLDRALPAGGWNYGNTRVLDNVLRPLPVTSGMALAALGGEPRDTRIDAGIAYLAETLAHVRAPLSLGWGVIGLGTWQARPAATGTWLAQSAAFALHRPQNTVYDALLLLAGAESFSLTRPTVNRNHG